jgi:hypothetical protein
LVAPAAANRVRTASLRIANGDVGTAAGRAALLDAGWLGTAALNIGRRDFKN